MKKQFFFGLLVVIISCVSCDRKADIALAQQSETSYRDSLCARPAYFFDPGNTAEFWIQDWEAKAFFNLTTDPAGSSIWDGEYHSKPLKGTNIGERVYFIDGCGGEKFYYIQDLSRNPETTSWWNECILLYEYENIWAAVEAASRLRSDEWDWRRVFAADIVLRMERLGVLHKDTKDMTPLDVKIVLIRYTDIVNGGVPRSIQEAKNYIKTLPEVL